MVFGFFEKFFAPKPPPTPASQSAPPAPPTPAPPQTRQPSVPISRPAPLADPPNKDAVPPRYIVDPGCLKKNPHVDGDLVIGGIGASHEKRRCDLDELPEGLHVRGALTLRSCFRLRALPRDLHVGTHLTIADCDRLQNLPPGLHVRGNLTICGGKSLTALPERLRVEGDFHLSGTRITQLPEQLTVGGSLVIQNRCQLTKLPASISVGNNLVLRRTRLADLPDGLRVGGNLILRGNRNFKALPAGLTVAGTVDASDCPALQSLPAGLRVPGNLLLRHCTSLRQLPPELQVGITLDLTGCAALQSLPPGMDLGRALKGPSAKQARELMRLSFRHRAQPALILADCPNVKTLPYDLKLHGPLDLARSGVTDLPAALHGAIVLWRGVLVPQDAVLHPDRLEPLRILQEPNAEIRRVMLDRVGIENLLSACGATTIHADTDAGGPRRLLAVANVAHRFLWCRCPSTARQYLLHVPPQMLTCHQAAAWLAGFDEPHLYNPQIET